MTFRYNKQSFRYIYFIYTNDLSFIEIKHEKLERS